MKAIVYHQYGSPEVLELQELDKPVPKDDEVLVHVHAASINILDWYGISGLGIGRIGGGLRRPKDPRVGVDFAGVVEGVGANVELFKPGDEVYGGRGGSFAEYVTIGEQRGIAPKPASVTFEQAATVPVAGLTALQGLRDKGQLQPGQKVLINGASGGVGTFAVQIAKAFGAEVTAVCHTRHVDAIRSLGADHVVDYAREDFTRSGQPYDLVLDVSGGRPWRECRRVLKPNATFVLIGGPKTNRLIGPLAHIIRIRLASLRASQKVIFFIANVNREDLIFMNELLEAGKVTPLIDRQYPLGELSQAMHHFAEGHPHGKIVITVPGNKTYEST
jgi:NADPH:quinone reductase-like Zn-dependent oxidoreductase